MRVIRTRERARGGQNLPGRRDRQPCIMGCVPETPDDDDYGTSVGESIDAFEHYTGRKR